MQRGKIILDSSLNRNRGLRALIPILCLKEGITKALKVLLKKADGYSFIALCCVFMVTTVVLLAGCDSDDEELIPVSETIEIEEAAKAAAPEEVTVSKLDKSSDALQEDALPENTAAKDVLAEDVEICVYVCGAVSVPNVYNLKSDSHIADAIAAAGGFSDDAGENYLNLAAPLSDGMKIYVPTEKELKDSNYSPFTTNGTADAENLSGDAENPGSAATPNNGAQKGGMLININTADESALMTLPGIGQSKADKIIEYREKNGKFSKTSDIMFIDGIKNGLYDKIKNLICTE